MYKLIVALAALSLTACELTDSDSDDPVGTVYIECADLMNEGDISDCEEQQTASLFPTAHAATTIIDEGVVSRGTMINVVLSVNNDTAELFTGYYDVIFDAGCNGADTWHMVNMSTTPDIQPGELWQIGIGGECGDMPLGDRTMTATLYGADPATVLDVVEVQFELVE